MFEMKYQKHCGGSTIDKDTTFSIINELIKRNKRRAVTQRRKTTDAIDREPFHKRLYAQKTRDFDELEKKKEELEVKNCTF